MLTGLLVQSRVQATKTFAKVKAVIQAALAKVEGVALVCWQHEAIAAIVKALAPEARVPEGWPGDRFNVIFRLERDDPTSPWTFSQLAPVMLAGDKAETL